MVQNCRGRGGKGRWEKKTKTWDAPCRQRGFQKPRSRGGSKEAKTGGNPGSKKHGRETGTWAKTTPKEETMDIKTYWRGGSWEKGQELGKKAAHQLSRVVQNM